MIVYILHIREFRKEKEEWKHSITHQSVYASAASAKKDFEFYKEQTLRRPWSKENDIIEDDAQDFLTHDESLLHHYLTQQWFYRASNGTMLGKIELLIKDVKY